MSRRRVDDDREHANRRLLGRDALQAAVLAAMGVAALDRLRWLAIDRFHPHALLSASARTVFASASPAASGFAGASQEMLFWIALLVLAVHAVRSLQRWPGAAILAGFLAAAALVPSSAHTAGEFFLYYGIGLVYLTAVVLFVACFARDNYLAYLLTAWVLALGEKAAALIGQLDGVLQGIALIVVLLAALLWAAAPALVRRRPS